MAMSNAEKQRRYRQRRTKDGTSERLSVIIGSNAKRALERLSQHYGLSQGNTLGLVLMTAERETLAGIKDKTEYYGGEVTR
ncbi:MAG: hypothetical protein L0H73_07070 [Nitrococcus sp.]|nr:hypothetical protein [Nitrococcus sp.]